MLAVVVLLGDNPRAAVRDQEIPRGNCTSEDLNRDREIPTRSSRCKQCEAEIPGSLGGSAIRGKSLYGMYGNAGNAMYRVC